MSWEPPHLATLRHPHIKFTSCWPSAVLFLHLIAHIFGYSPDQSTSSTQDSFLRHLEGPQTHYTSLPGISGYLTSLVYNKNVVKQQTVEEYDFIIVGAGSAGCVVANRLSEIKQWKILLLEAGIEEPFVADVPAYAQVMRGTSIDWNYRTQPENKSCLAYGDKGCEVNRGKVMGGSSTINSMIYIRGNKRDYDGWAEMGNYGWNYEEVLRYFLKSEDNEDEDILKHNPEYHHKGGYQTVERFHYQDSNIQVLIDAWKDLGYPEVDMNAESQLGVMLYQHTSRHGERLSTNGAFIRSIRRKRSNLTIRSQAYVTRVLIDPRTKRAFGVEYVRDGDARITTVRARKEVILSAGSINSPKILMLSGVGPREHLDYFGIHVIQNLPVGENLQDHVTLHGVIVSLNKTQTTVNEEQRKHDLENYMLYRKGPLSSTGTTQVGVFTVTEYSEKDVPDIQYSFPPRIFEDYNTSFISTPKLPPASYYNTFYLLPIILQPYSRGMILLNSTDPTWGAPSIYPNFFGDSRDLETLVSGIRQGLQMLSTKPMRDVGAQLVDYPAPECSKYKFASDDYWRCVAIFYTATIFHPVGTCKMGPSNDPEAVVDPELRVHGIKNLRVIDSSIMPNITRGNTNAPTIMIGEKGSDLIKKHWLHRSQSN